MASLDPGFKTLIATTPTGAPAAVVVQPTRGLASTGVTVNEAPAPLGGGSLPATPLNSQAQAVIANNLRGAPGIDFSVGSYIDPTTSSSFNISVPQQSTGPVSAGTATKSGTGTGGAGTTTGGSSTSAPAEKPCPDCGKVPGMDNSGKQTVNKKKKGVKDTNSWYPNQPFAGLNFLQIGALVLESIGSFFNNLLDIFEIKEGKCRTCEGKRTVEDKSDQTQEIQRTAAAANAQKEKLTELEGKASGGAGLGGNDVAFIVGNKFVKVGAAYNDSQSYESIPEGKYVPSGEEINKKGVTKRSRKVAQVNGLNPLPTIGGNYTMEVGNHFKLRAGAQGIELSTEGPLIIKAGQTQMVGPEVVIGTASGETRIAGNHLQLDGESIALTPGRSGDGQVIIQGTATCTGNIIATGGAHIDGDLSFVSATCPYKEERTKHSSQETEFGGPARWSVNAAVQGLKDFLRTTTIRTLDPSLIVASPRQILNFYMDAREAAEKALPLELLPTGVILPGTCYVVGALGPSVNPAPIPIFNFPHHHTLTDQMHAHNMRVPNINMLEDDEQVRSTAKVKELRSPAPINKESALLKLFRLIQIPYQAAVAVIQRLT